MKKLRVITRVLVVNNGKILLARNKGANFWYPPGGGWEFEDETIKECAAREVYEETGYHAAINDLVMTQEFRDGDNICFETFWSAKLSEVNTQDGNGLESHVDLDENGDVDEARWFAEEELGDLKVLPKKVKEFKTLIDSKSDLFLGTFGG